MGGVAGGLTAEELTAAKEYMLVDGAENDALVSQAVLGARVYLDGAGVSLPETESPRRALYDLVCHSMALSVYDQPDPVITGTIVAENPMLRKMLHQLRLTEPGGGI